jgi:hypothetical protein
VGPLDLLTRPLRSLLGEAEQTEKEVARHSPIGETRELEAKLEAAVHAIHRGTDALESQVQILDALAQSLPPLTEAVTRLTIQIDELLQVTAPLATAERDVSRLEHLLGRHRR